MKHTMSRIRLVAVAVASLVLTSCLFAATDFTVPPGRAALPQTTALGPDGNVWFAENWGGKIGRISPTGVITEFPIPGAQSLTGIAAGPDGNIWFTDQLTGKIGRMSTSGAGLTQFPLLSLSSHPQGIRARPTLQR